MTEVGPGSRYVRPRSGVRRAGMEDRKRAISGTYPSLMHLVLKVCLLPPGTMQSPRASQAQDPPGQGGERKPSPHRPENILLQAKNLIEPNHRAGGNGERGVWLKNNINSHLSVIQLQESRASFRRRLQKACASPHVGAEQSGMFT